MRLAGIARRTRDTPHPDKITSTLLERTVVSTKGGPIGKVEALEPFDLEVEEGHLVRVLLAEQLRLEPVDISEPTWGDIENDEAFASLRPNAPGPHVEVHVRRSSIEDGTRVEILAQDDAEMAFIVTGGHRDAPKRELSTVTARVIAGGPDAASIIDRLLDSKPARTPGRKKARRPSKFETRPSLTPVVLCAIGLVFVLAAGWLATIKLAPLTVDLGVIGIVFIAGALSSWALSRVPRFVSDGRVVGGKLGEDLGSVVYFTMVFPIAFVVLPLFGDYAGPWQTARTPPDQVHNASWVGLLSLAGWSLVVAYFALTRGQSEARLFRALLGAPPLPESGALSHTWGAFEGVVRDPTPTTAEGEAVALVHVISEEMKPGSDPNIYTERILSKGTFFVDEPEDGKRSFEIHPDGAVWTSSVAISVPRPSTGGRSVIEYLRAVPLRGSVLVAGRFDRHGSSWVGRVGSGGPESLLFVAVREGRSARNECRAMLFLRRFAFVIAIAALAVSIGTAFFVEPRLPAFHTPEGGD